MLQPVPGQPQKILCKWEMREVIGNEGVSKLPDS